MAGYVPLFSSLTTGTLCGRWPDIGLWPIVLSLSDKNGVVDVTPAYIAGVTGLPLAEVAACMKRFCEPDPYSRSEVDGGARLVLLDEHRDWGWRVVNHSSYREKARKQMQQIRATESGRDAERKRIEREKKSSDVQPRPAETSADRPSYSDADADAYSNKEKEKKADTSTSSPVHAAAQEVFQHWQREWDHPSAKLDPKRRKRIEVRLKNFTVAELRDAISGFKHSPWHTGQDPKGQGVVYDGIETLLRDDAQVEVGLQYFAHPPRPPPKPEQLSPVERVLRANGVNRDERVVSEQFGSFNDGLGDLGGDVRNPSYSGFRRIGS